MTTHMSRDYIDRNLEAFQKLVPSLLKDHLGRYALMRDSEIVGIYDTVRDAQMTGRKFFVDRKFSIQKIQTKPVDLGFFSHAMHIREAQ